MKEFSAVGLFKAEIDDFELLQPNKDHLRGEGGLQTESKL